MKKHLAAAISAGLWLVSGCQDNAPQTSTTKPAALTSGAPAVVPPVTPPATQPTAQQAVAPAPWDAAVAGRSVYFHVRAEGVQIYEPKATDGKLAWALKAPEAILYDDKGKKLGMHYGSPTGPVWELVDGSKIVGETKGTMDQPGSIPWLTIWVKAHEGAKGKLSSIGYVKRVDTDGGGPPATTPAPEQAGKEERVQYHATYLFYAGK